MASSIQANQALKPLEKSHDSVVLGSQQGPKGHGRGRQGQERQYGSEPGLALFDGCHGRLDFCFERRVHNYGYREPFGIGECRPSQNTPNNLGGSEQLQNINFNLDLTAETHKIRKHAKTRLTLSIEGIERYQIHMALKGIFQIGQKPKK
jgi:hypothetical protein